MSGIIRTKGNKRTKSKKSYGPAVSYLLSVLNGLIPTAILFGGISMLLLNNGSFTVFYKVLIYAVIGLGAFICGFTSYKKIKGRGIINGAVGGGIYCVIVIVILCIFIKFNISPSILYILPVSIGCGIAGGITGANL